MTLTSPLERMDVGDANRKAAFVMGDRGTDGSE